MSKKLLISHTDLDGHGVLVIARAFSDLCKFDELWSKNYDFDLDPEEFDRMCKFDEIVVADLSLNFETYNNLNRIGIVVKTFDHHESSASMKDLPGFTSHDQNRCGTKIFFEDYIVKICGLRRAPQHVLDFVELVHTYDMWCKTDEKWEEALNLNRVLYGTQNFKKTYEEGSTERFTLTTLSKFRTDHDAWFWFPDEVEIYERAKEMEERRYQEALATISLREDKQGRFFGVFVLPGKISIVCSRILSSEKYGFLDYCVCVNSYGGISGKISMRSEKIDCTEYSCVEGHKAAAGGMLSEEQARLFLKDPTWVPVLLSEDLDRSVKIIQVSPSQT